MDGIEGPGIPTTELANGLKIPMLGLGTSHQGGYSHSSVVYALKECGIRHIDTAKRYGCESHLKKAISESGVHRGSLWITTKLWPGDYGYETTKAACLESCKRLGVDYIDLYLMHWPDGFAQGKTNRELRAETWQALEELYDEDKETETVHSIPGVVSLKPCTIAAEYHPFQRPQELVDYCRSHGIVFEGYCPLAKGQALSHPDIIKKAEKYNCSPSQICIRWSIQNGVVTIPKSTKKERIWENCQVFDFSLSKEDMIFLNSMKNNKKLITLNYPLWKEQESQSEPSIARKVASQ
uniref:uncharacterized oxidoreductase ZK1290.5 n=1 Tax=Pristiophorus japonicus TaxID=55135 RepID=UPI00398EEAB5